MLPLTSIQHIFHLRWRRVWWRIHHNHQRDTPVNRDPLSSAPPLITATLSFKSPVQSEQTAIRYVSVTTDRSMSHTARDCNKSCSPAEKFNWIGEFGPQRPTLLHGFLRATYHGIQNKTTLVFSNDQRASRHSRHYRIRRITQGVVSGRCDCPSRHR